MEAMFPREMLYGGKGKRKTQALFVETARVGDDPFLSLRPSKDGGAVSLRDLFIAMVPNDPTEVEFAETVFGDYEHWLELLQCKWMEPYVTKWRAITDAKRKQIAFQSIISEIQEGGRNSYTASKFIIEEPWKDKRNPKTKQQVKDSTEEAYRGISSDVTRLKEEGFLQ